LKVSRNQIFLVGDSENTVGCLQNLVWRKRLFPTNYVFRSSRKVWEIQQLWLSPNKSVRSEWFVIRSYSSRVSVCVAVRKRLIPTNYVFRSSRKVWEIQQLWLSPNKSVRSEWFVTRRYSPHVSVCVAVRWYCIFLSCWVRPMDCRLVRYCNIGPLNPFFVWKIVFLLEHNW